MQSTLLKLKFLYTQLQETFPQKQNTTQSTPEKLLVCCFYYVSTEMKNWTESRINCMERGADLSVWIGLTDANEEGIWKWVNGSTLTSGFWSAGQPNGRRIQNCVVSSSISWADTQCNYTYKWICENNILPVILP
uniref:C-type lectin domain-containing protein n=1 Tax=Sinocyclocheilus anshuiensis TaxID=1608454 RepID=A0A671NQL9_9TELE